MITEYIESFQFSRLNDFLVFPPSFSTTHFSYTKSSRPSMRCLIINLFVLLVVALFHSPFFWSDVFWNYQTDIDECTSNKHNCHVQSTCNNTIGGYMCTCNDGYWGDGITCKGTLVKSGYKCPASVPTLQLSVRTWGPHSVNSKIVRWGIFQNLRN